MLKIPLPLFLLMGSSLPAQSFDKSFGSTWYETWWDFDFNADGTFVRTSEGHFGSPVYTGTYTIYKDTLEILTGFNCKNHR